MFSENIKKTGCIEVICGSMFSGKTEELIRRIRRAKFANLRIEIFKPTIDTRYSEDDVVSHDFHKIPCHSVKDPKEMLNVGPDVQVVGIDEAQFYDMSLVDVAQELADRGIRVIIAITCAPRFGIAMVWCAVPVGWFANWAISYAEYRTGKWKTM